MKQHGNERWYGHREITREAVGRLFDERAGADGRIRGIDERSYANALDHGQARQDRLLSIGLIRGLSGTRLTTPYLGLGPTTHSAWANPRVQREHFMADPYRGSLENLRVNVAYVLIRAAAAPVYSGDPTAPVLSLHVFTPGHAIRPGRRPQHPRRRVRHAAHGLRQRTRGRAGDAARPRTRPRLQPAAG